MRTIGTVRKAREKIIIALSEFNYLTPTQITRLLYAPSSITHVYEQMRSLIDRGLVLTLGGRAVSLPLIYTLSGTGRQYASLLGAPLKTRFRPLEEEEKGHNPYFLKHTVAVTDVLIAARLLSERVPAVRLTRMYTERELKRKIHVQLPGQTPEGTARFHTICIEPDGSCEFLITETWHEKPQTWVDFFYIEVYRNLPPAEWRFKQKIQGYVYAVDEGWHEAFFHTPALSIAVIAQTEQMATTLKRWTEEILVQMERQPEGEWFFFCSLDTATASPEELFLSPVWEQAFGTITTPLFVLGTSDVPSGE
jgi:Replication-relaxation